MRFFPLIFLPMWLILLPLMLAPPALAQSFVAPQIAKLSLQDGALAVHSRFHLRLSPTALDALEQGVPISFVLDFKLTRPHFEAWKSGLTRLFSSGGQIRYKLSYSPLSQQYRLYNGDLYQNYKNLTEALAAIGGIRGWRVLEAEQVGERSLSDFEGAIRLQLDRSQLPRPFQLNTLHSSDWKLDSGWISLQHDDKEAA